MNLGDNPARHSFVLKNLVLIDLFQISHNCVTECMLQGKLLEIFSQYKCKISQYVIFLSNRRRKFKLLDLQGDPLPPQFPCLVGYPDLPTRKVLGVVDLLTLMIFFYRKKITACKIKDGKEERIFYFLMVFNLLQIIHPFQSKKHLRT